MSVETEADFRGLREAGLVVCETLRRLRAAARPGITTGELDALAAECLREHGARSGPALDYGFPRCICISVNEEAVHGLPGARILRAGDLVKLDVTVELDGYYADAAITVALPPVPPQVDALRRCAEAAFGRGIAQLRPGVPLWQVGRTIEHEVQRRGFRVLRDLAGHGIGRRVHEAPEVPNYGDPGARTMLRENLVLALEPIVSVGSRRSRMLSDGWTIASSDGSLTAHYEHTVIVRRQGAFLLTAA
jgi:methionyl aminopeptidase